jgi:hypothetical protein
MSGGLTIDIARGSKRVDTVSVQCFSTLHKSRSAANLVYLIFDALIPGGKDVMKEPLAARRKQQPSTGIWQRIDMTAYR